MSNFKTVDEYVASLDGVTKKRLIELRTFIRSLLPGAEERISYGIPAYFVDGKMICYISGYKHHAALYPGRTNSEAYNQLAAKYAHGKSTARFSNDEPLPKDIIERFIETRLKEVGIVR